MDRRPKRRCVTRKDAMPSAVHYVGYVEDDETPEMIMRKFEELDRVVAAAQTRQSSAAGPSSSHAATPAPESDKENMHGTAGLSGAHQTAGTSCQGPSAPSALPTQPASTSSAAAGSSTDQTLDESLLLQVFKQTSIFNVRSALAHNAVLLSNPPAASRHEEGRNGQQPMSDEDITEVHSAGEDDTGTTTDMEYLKGFWSNEDGFVTADNKTQKSKTHKKKDSRGRSKGQSSQAVRDKEPSMWKVLGIAARERNIRHQMVMQYNKDTHALIRRKMKPQDQKDEIIQMRVPPPPLPTAWGRTVTPYDPTAPRVQLAVTHTPVPLLPHPLPNTFTALRDALAAGRHTTLSALSAHTQQQQQPHSTAPSCLDPASSHPQTAATRHTAADTPGAATGGISDGPALTAGAPIHTSLGEEGVLLSPPPLDFLTHTDLHLHLDLHSDSQQATLPHSPPHTFTLPVAGLQQPIACQPDCAAFGEQTEVATFMEIDTLDGLPVCAMQQDGASLHQQHIHMQQPQQVLQPLSPAHTQLTRLQNSGLATATSGVPVQGAAGCVGAHGSVQRAAEDQQQGAVGQLENGPGGYFEVPDLATCDLYQHIGRGRQFNVVLINSGWQVVGAGDSHTKLVSRLRKLPMPSLCPGGFVFVWSDKTHIHAICKQLYSWGYTYVENLAWVWMHANNSILRRPSAYLSRSHLTLIIFRKEGEGKSIHLRHQRNPDVILDCLRDDPATRSPPQELYRIIETMLPDEASQGRCLELWAPQGVRRPGWVHAVEANT